jgi:hypothetical protein
MFKKMLQLLLLFLAVLQGAAAQGISVSLSDNLIVIDDKRRSGSIDLVNLGDDPMEFSVKPVKDASSVVKSAESMLRWSPQRTVAPAHRSVSLRVLARPSPDLPAGEYAFQFNVTATVQRPESAVKVVEEGKAAKDQLIAVSSPVVPVLPVTVYVRHGISTPLLDIEPLMLTPDDKDSLGYFRVVKRTPNTGFVGQIQVVERESGAVLSSGRLHVGQMGADAKVTMPRLFFPAERASLFCLKLWSQFPGEGEPYAQLCD